MLAAPGVIGARQAGAGFGGCMVALVDSECTGAFSAAIRDKHHYATQTSPEISVVDSAPGAGLFLKEKLSA